MVVNVLLRFDVRPELLRGLEMFVLGTLFRIRVEGLLEILIVFINLTDLASMFVFINDLSLKQCLIHGIDKIAAILRFNFALP